jgi:hypothetical protein
LEEHDTEKYHKQIFVKLKKYAKGGSTYEEGGEIKGMKKIKLPKSFDNYMPNVKHIYFDDKNERYYFLDFEGDLMELRNTYTLEELRKQNIIFAKGGSTYAEGGKTKGQTLSENFNRNDKVKNIEFWKNDVIVENKGKVARVDLDKGERIELNAKGGSTYAEGGEIKNGVYEYIELKGTRFEKNRGYTIRADKWNDLIEKGVLDSNDINLADDWRTAIKEENWGKYTRNMYSPKLDRLREQTENEFYNNKLYSKGGSTYAEGKEVYNAHILTNDNKLIHRRYPKKITHNEIYKEYKDKGVEIKDSQIHFAKPIDFFDKLREETKKYVRENMNDDVDSENIFISSMQKGNEYIATEIKGDTISGKSFTITPKDLFEVGFKGNSYAKGGSVARVKTIVYSPMGEVSLDEYRNLSNEDMMGKSMMNIDEVKDRLFSYNDEAYDYEDEIRKIDNVDELADFLYENNLAQVDNTYNQSWWGGVRMFSILNNNGDNYDSDYPTIIFLSKHRGGDVRGNYEKFEAFDIGQYGYEEIPFVSATTLTYEVTDGDKKAVLDSDDIEGYDVICCRE